MRQFLLALVVTCGGGNNTVIDGAPPDISTDGRLNVDDGTPTRMPCTSNFGVLLPASGTFGRLDGYLVAIVAPSGMNSCNADSSHVHLQVRMMNAVYDVAVDATDSMTMMDDVHTTTIDHDLPDLGWKEGWHSNLLVDYTQFGVHSIDMPFETKQQVVDTLNSDLSAVNHISVYMTTYGGDGGHLVHRNGNGHDGMIVTAPLSQPSHFRLLNFTDVTF